MTANQIAYQKNVIEREKEAAKLEESRRHNLAEEQLKKGYFDLEVISGRHVPGVQRLQNVRTVSEIGSNTTSAFKNFTQGLSGLVGLMK